VLFTGLLPDGYHGAAITDGGIRVSQGDRDEFGAAVVLGKVWTEESDQTSTIVSSAVDGSAGTTEINDAELPVASSDGKYVAYLRSIKGRSRIWLRSLNQAGLADVPLTPPELNVSEMSFGADDSLIFAAAEDHRPPGLFSVDLAGHLRPLFLGEARYPAVSPDARWLAYSRLSHGYWNLWLTDLHSGSLRRITDEPCNDISPAWSIDGHELIFASDCGRALWFTALRHQSIR
jgi:Tol biopolymer transport system component